MNVKYTGTFEQLKEQLKPLGTQWDESQVNKKVLRVQDGVLNWFETTGTLSVQGKDPGKSLIEKRTPHLLYPEEYKDLVSEEPTVQQTPSQQVEQDLDRIEQTIERRYLNGKFQDSELIIGIVNAVGTESRRVLGPLTDRLKGFGYVVTDIRVSELMPGTVSSTNEYTRIKESMEKGDNLRCSTQNNAILAVGAVHWIQSLRKSEKPKTAYIINSLKHPDEVEFLRKVYGDGFYMFGIHAEEKRRLNFLVNDKSLTQEEANELIKIDEEEKVSYGQKTRDTFHLADFYIELGRNDDQVKNTIQRFLELIFSNPYKNPTFDEFAMFMAFNSSIRSSDLSRQVGAIIARNNQIIATGTNDCPKYGGGQYWAEPDPSTGEVKDVADGKDFMRQQDSNKAAQTAMISEIVDNMVSSSIVDEDKREELRDLLRHSVISDLTEFGRVVHAEMEAILSCAREGISTVDATLYCTTFPCHNCAKHIIDAGIKRVVYVEPYPKSRALDLHSESIELRVSPEVEPHAGLVTFEPFIGVGARRFLDLFSMALGAGMKLKRKDKQGNTFDWKKEAASARTPLLPKSYHDIEVEASQIWNEAVGSE